MITVSSFFSGTLATVDSVISNFVNHAYTGLVQANAGIITLLFTFYVMMLGLQFLHHHHHFDLSMVIRRIIVMLCVYGLVMNWSLYHRFVYNIFTNEPGNLAHILIRSAGETQPGNIVDALNELFAAVVSASSGLFSQISFSVSGLAFIFYAGLVFVIGILLCVYALLLFVYAKMMMAVALALGPVFILFILWDTTKGLFSSWLNFLITTALIPVVTAAVLVLMLSVIRVTLPDINQPVEQMQFVGIAPFLGLALTTTLILSQVLRVCSALGGGISLSSMSVAGGIASSVMEKSGMNAAGRFVKNKMGKRKSRGAWNEVI